MSRAPRSRASSSASATSQNSSRSPTKIASRPWNVGAVVLHEMEDAHRRRHEGDQLDAPFEHGRAQADERPERVPAHRHLRARRSLPQRADGGAGVFDLAEPLAVEPFARADAAVVEAQVGHVLPSLFGEDLRNREHHRAVHRPSVERVWMAEHHGALGGGGGADARLERRLAGETGDRDELFPRDGRGGRSLRFGRRGREVANLRHRLTLPTRRAPASPSRRSAPRPPRAERAPPSSGRSRSAA